MAQYQIMIQARHYITAHPISDGFLPQGQEDFESTDVDSHCELASLNSSVGGLKSVPPFRVQQKPIITTDIDGLNDELGWLDLPH